MKIINTILLALLIASFGFAQDAEPSGNKHTITFERGFFSDTYTVDGAESDCDAVEKLLIDVPEANDKWGTGNILRYASWGIDGVGGFFIGYAIAMSQSPYEEDINSYKRTLALGAAIVLVGIIVEKVGNSKKDGAIELYNSENGKRLDMNQNDEIPETATSYNIQIAPTAQGGIGLAFNF